MLLSSSCQPAIYVYSNLYLISESSALDRQLDSLNSALDAIEQRNDDIHAKARAILRENKEARVSLGATSSPVGSGTDSDKGTREEKQEGEPS